MSTKLYITSLSGTSPYTFYVCGTDLNNCTLIGTGDTTSPTLTFTLPSIFAGAPQVILKMVDSNNCETFKLLNCYVSCPFDVIIESVECDFCITVEHI